jgi:hypothetical protein
MSRPSFNIYLGCQVMSRPLIFLSIRTLLRYSDLIALSIKSLTKPSEFFVIQNKTKRPVLIKFKVFSQQLTECLNELSDIPITCTYSQLCRDIQKNKKKVLPGLLYGVKDGTHLFRHIEASFQKYKGVEDKIISKSLGHVDNESLNSYIHKELNPFF